MLSEGWSPHIRIFTVSRLHRIAYSNLIPCCAGGDLPVQDLLSRICMSRTYTASHREVPAHESTVNSLRVRLHPYHHGVRRPQPRRDSLHTTEFRKLPSFRGSMMSFLTRVAVRKQTKRIFCRSSRTQVGMRHSRTHCLCAYRG